MLKASVIIPHYGDVAPLHICLNALATCTDRHRVEIIVVGNDPVPISAAFQRNHTGVRFLHAPQPGAAHARNAGVAQARADILFFTDSDCIPDQAALTRVLASAPAHDILGGAVTATVPQGQPLTSAQAFEAVFAFDQAAYVRKKGFSVTACLVTHRRVFDLVGGFKPNVSEDLDWCHRATAIGLAITYDPSIRVSHPCRSTWTGLRSKWRRLTAQTYALNAESRTKWIVKACLMPLSIAAHAPRILSSPKLPKARDKVTALFMLARLRLWRMGEMLRLSFQSRA